MLLGEQRHDGCEQFALGLLPDSVDREAIDRYFVPAGPTAANLPHAAAAVDRWDMQTDGRTDTVPFIDAVAYYANSVDNWE